MKRIIFYLGSLLPSLLYLVLGVVVLFGLYPVPPLLAFATPLAATYWLKYWLRGYGVTMPTTYRYEVEGQTPETFHKLTDLVDFLFGPLDEEDDIE